ncbi:hypothetical protein LC085_17105 [Bacillus tianshenii]|uniref:hypothetical protein n=1 Tax=Sutcliffiella tianshenii TaxID=1463404 RepID=UPI001CD55A92|nr:hypothetical protein [Bacillus tianshenii]MCA1321627.1 hypothetical protein [Bacillus tianshenii]
MTFQEACSLLPRKLFYSIITGILYACVVGLVYSTDLIPDYLRSLDIHVYFSGGFMGIAAFSILCLPLFIIPVLFTSTISDLIAINLVKNIKLQLVFSGVFLVGFSLIGDWDPDQRLSNILYSTHVLLFFLIDKVLFRKWDLSMKKYFLSLLFPVVVLGVFYFISFFLLDSN